MGMGQFRAAAMLVITIAYVGSYIAVVLSRAHPGALADVTYERLMLATIGGAIITAIVVEILARIFWFDRHAADAGAEDERDRRIDVLGETFGSAIAATGALGALLMTLAELDHFWIAHAIYLGFALASVVSSALKLVFYRWGMPRW